MFIVKFIYMTWEPRVFLFATPNYGYFILQPIAFNISGHFSILYPQRRWSPGTSGELISATIPVVATARYPLVRRTMADCGYWHAASVWRRIDRDIINATYIRRLNRIARRRLTYVHSVQCDRRFLFLRIFRRICNQLLFKKKNTDYV